MLESQKEGEDEKKTKKIVGKIEEEEEENSSGTMLLMKTLWEYIHCSSAILSPYAVLYRAGFLGELLWHRGKERARSSLDHIYHRIFSAFPIDSHDSK